MTGADACRASVKPSPVHQLSIAAAFNGLTESERRYAHHMSRCVASVHHVNNLVVSLIVRTLGLPGKVHE
jgi:hypothetical protein